jgi:hypothetical protein
MKEKYYVAGMAGLLFLKIVNRGTAHGWFDGNIPPILVHVMFYLGVGLCVLQILIWLHALARSLLSRIHGSRST